MIDAEKAFERIQHPLMIKTLQKVSIEGNYFHIIKAIYNKPTANTIVNCEKVKAFPLRSGTKTRVPTLTTIIWHSFWSPRHGNQRRKGNKEIQIGREVKLSLFADDISFVFNHNLYLLQYWPYVIYPRNIWWISTQNNFSSI